MSRVGEMGVGETGIGETGVGEMGNGSRRNGTKSLAFGYLSWIKPVKPVLGGCFFRRAPEGSNRGLFL